MMTRDYLSVKVWDLNMENRPVETYQVRRRISGVVFIHKKILNVLWDAGAAKLNQLQFE